MSGSSLSFLTLVPIALAGFLLLAAALNDMRHFKIPNWMSLALAALFPFYAMLTGAPFLPHVIAGVAVFAIGFGFYAAGLLGGGDVKLMAAAALWAGTQETMMFLLITTSFGGVLAAIYAFRAYQKFKKDSKTEAHSVAPSDKAVMPWRKAPVPYGVAIACGGWVILFHMARGLT